MGFTQSHESNIFTASEAESRKGQLNGFTVAERDKKISSLVPAITGCNLRSVCTRVRQDHYNDIFKGKIPEKWDSSYYLLFSSLIGSTLMVHRSKGTVRPIEFVFDSDQRHGNRAYRLAQNFRPNGAFEGLLNVSHKDDEEFLPLQAADLFAWNVRRSLAHPHEARRDYHDAIRLPGSVTV